MARLIVNPRTPQAYEIQLKPGENYLGRGFANDFKLEDPSISGSHCQILVHGSAVVIRDLGSTNGTFVNRAPIKEASLLPGQIVRMGAVEMVFEGDGAAAAVATPVTAVAPAVPVAAPAPSAARAAGPAMPSAAMASPSPGPMRIAPTAAAAPAAAAPKISLKIAPASPAETASEPLPPPPRPSMPPVAEAPAVVPPVPAVSGKSVCKFHPKSPARWMCPKCKRFFCDLCVATRSTSEGQGHLFRGCGVECHPVEVKLTLPVNASFMSLLPGAFGYPFKRGGAFILICATVFFVIVSFLKSYSWYLQIVFMGYLFAYMQNVIHTTAGGDESEASLPDITNFVSDILVPCLQLIATVVLCFLPAVALSLWRIFGDADIPAWALIAGIVFGCFYYPMAFLGVAMFDSVGGVNPVLVIPSICKVPLQYLITCVCLGVVITVYWVGAALLPALIPIIIVPTLISSFIWLYFLTVQCRILGLLYLSNKEELGWFSRR